MSARDFKDWSELPSQDAMDRERMARMTCGECEMCTHHPDVPGDIGWCRELDEWLDDVDMALSILDAKCQG